MFPLFPETERGGGKDLVIENGDVVESPYGRLGDKLVGSVRQRQQHICHAWANPDNHVCARHMGMSTRGGYVLGIYFLEGDVADGLYRGLKKREEMVGQVRQKGERVGGRRLSNNYPSNRDKKKTNFD